MSVRVLVTHINWFKEERQSVEIYRASWVFGRPSTRPGSIHRLLQGFQHWCYLPLGTAPATCTPASLIMDTEHCGQSRCPGASKQLSDSILLSSVFTPPLFSFPSLACVPWLIDWCCASTLAVRETQKLHFWYFQLQEWKPDSASQGCRFPCHRRFIGWKDKKKKKKSMAFSYDEDPSLPSEGDWNFVWILHLSEPADTLFVQMVTS